MGTEPPCLPKRRFKWRLVRAQGHRSSGSRRRRYVAFLMIILDVVIIYQLMVNWSEEV
jgi:hypothetical protein